MRTRLRIVLLGALAGLTAHAQAGVLRVSADQQEVELGRPIWLTVYTDQDAISLDNLDLSGWQGRVAVPRNIDVSREAGGRSQRARLKIYPLREGPLELPPLYFIHETSNVLRLKVLPAVEAGSGRPMNFQCQASANTAWQSQQLAVGCTLDLGTGYALFRQNARNTAELQIHALQKQQHQLGHAADRFTRYRLGWLISPSRAGERLVTLPPIDYLRDDVVVRRFYVPPFRLQVRALPAWLPGTVPVGKVTLTEYGPARFWLDSGVLSQLHLGLRLDAVAAGMVPDYAAQLRSNRDWRFYPPRLEHSDAVAGRDAVRRLQYTIPLQARAIGVRRLPDLRLQYFDPASGSLRTLQVRGPLLWVVNGWIKLILALLALLLCVYLGRRFWRWWRHYWYRYRIYRALLRRLARCDKLPELRDIMLGMAQAEGWRSNLTYRQWQTRMRQVAQEAARIPVAELYAASYGSAGIDTAGFTQSLLRICRRRRLGLS